MSQAGAFNLQASSDSSVLEFTGGAGTAGAFPVTPNLAGAISLSSTAGSLTLTGGANSINFDLSPLTNHAVLVGSGTATLTPLAVGTTGQVLTGVTGGDPVWTDPEESVLEFTGGAGSIGAFPVTPNLAGAISLSSTAGSLTLTGGANSINFDLSPLTNHAVLVGSGTATLTPLAVGTTGQVLTGVTGGDPVWTDPSNVLDPFGTVYLVDDFISCLEAGPLGNLNWDVGGTINAVNGTSTNPGQVQVGANGFQGSINMGNQTNSYPITLGGGAITVEFLVNIAATNNGTFIFGLGAGILSAEPTSGVYFLYSSGTNSGKWVGKTANASVRSSANSAVAVVGGSWVRLKITVNAGATSVAFFVNGTEISNSPLTTNIPTQALSPRVYNSGGTAGGGSYVDVDLFTLTHILTVSR